ncbi:FmdE, Molybdenum formylmethanofuran dehydrogenase operon [Bremerella volcania]|uniref:FmdE, Molybdenum formylmethanofuran dehydrogenase operon n=1 Tax=Bremerella volcania TaxID=2527984 RepID=A0A518C5U4_9BACT|nr:FmdE family protein [Bremerella volcania]QDU74581.1 FmdE, Molybdenum formylmethanofuran dehydrogenase operon [Bremerella volcania]
MTDPTGLLEWGIQFHGHKCPAMPLGIRAGLEACANLNVPRSRNKKLHVIAETGKGHAAGCCLDGVMIATGCTYGKSNIEKLYYNKMAFTLIDVASGHRVRLALKPDFFENALQSRFVQQRKAGVPPQDIPAEVVDLLIERIMGLDASEFLAVESLPDEVPPVRKGLFDTARCARCGEVVFVDKLRVLADKRLACVPCSGYDS